MDRSTRSRPDSASGSLGTQALQGDSLVLTDKITKIKQAFLKNGASTFSFGMVPEKQVIYRKSYESIDDSKFLDTFGISCIMCSMSIYLYDRNGEVIAKKPCIFSH